MSDFSKVEQTEIVVAIIEEKRELPIKKIRAHIEVAEGITLTAKEITEILKDEGVSTAKLGFASDYYDYLGAAQRSLQDAKDFIALGNAKVESDNISKHESHYLNIHALSVTIWEAKEEG